MNIIRKTIIIGLILTSFGLLFSFQPEQHHFINDYQYQLFRSWLHRGGFGKEGPAKLSQHNFVITFSNNYTKEQADAEFDLVNGKIAVQIEKIAVDESFDKQAELSYRYYLEQLLFRLNSSHTFFVTDFIEHFQIDIVCEDKDDIVSYLVTQTEDRLSATFVKFAKLNNKYYYDIVLNNKLNVKIIFNETRYLRELAVNLRKEEFQSEEIKDLVPYEVRTYPDEPLETVAYPIEPPTYRPALPKDIQSMKISDFIDSYRNHRWSREMLHNKIGDRNSFFKQEFPYHSIRKYDKHIELIIDKFQGRLSGNLNLIEKPLRDGVQFSSNNSYSIDEYKTVILSSGDTVSLNYLSDEDIDAVVPYMNQLVAMHRVLGTRLLNFLLIPADVPTTLVIRDPDRNVLNFDSYTDLILMLSYYWSNRNIYFSIENVKKINNYIEFSTILVAFDNEENRFDFAEINFSLNHHYRIDIAMVVLHTNITE